MGHLINTFVLLTFLTLTAWFAAKERRVSLTVDAKTLVLIGLGVLGLLAVGLSGSLAALSSMLFPSQTLAEGVAKDFSETSNIILRLRLSHPILSILTSVYMIFLAGWLKAKSGDANTAWWSSAVSLLVIGQVIFGGAACGNSHIRRERPGSRRPDHDEDVLVGECGIDLCRVRLERKFYVNRRRSVFLVLDLRFSQRGLIVDAPIDRAKAFVDVATFEKLSEKPSS